MRPTVTDVSVAFHIPGKADAPPRDIFGLDWYHQRSNSRFDLERDN